MHKKYYDAGYQSTDVAQQNFIIRDIQKIKTKRETLSKKKVYIKINIHGKEPLNALH